MQTKPAALKPACRVPERLPGDGSFSFLARNLSECLGFSREGFFKGERPPDSVGRYKYRELETILLGPVANLFCKPPQLQKGFRFGVCRNHLE